MVTIKDVYEAEKSISYFPGWLGPEQETSYVWFDAPIDIGGVTETGLVIHGGCYADRPECHVTLELRYQRKPGRRCRPLERLDWRSLEGGHSNPRKPPSKWAGQRVSDTHLHDFALNWSETEQRMRMGNLPTAREIKTNLNDFQGLRCYMGKRLRIKNMDIVECPPWEYSLFTQDWIK